MAFGTSTVIINAARLKISVGGSEVSLTSDVKVTHRRTVDRLNTRAGAIDTNRWVIEEIEFTAALTELLLTELQTDATLDAFMALTSKSWLINGVSISGIGGDNTSDTYNATLIDYEELGPENGIAQTRIKLRILAGAL